jgi:hypothetical protein
VYGTRERQRLALYREIFLLQNATSLLAASARCRGVETASLVFKRTPFVDGLGVGRVAS